MYKCEECNLEFETFQAKANHHRWKHLGYAFKNEKTKNEFKNKSDDISEKKYGKIIEEDIKCFKEKCNNYVHIKYREGKKKEKYFCSTSCSNSHIKSKETKIKISNTIKQKIQRGEKM